jgi:Transposase
LFPKSCVALLRTPGLLVMSQVAGLRSDGAMAGGAIVTVTVSVDWSMLTFRFDSVRRSTTASSVPLREATARPAPPVPASKTVAAWILTPSGSLTAQDRDALARITGRCDKLATVRALVRQFADMLCHRNGTKLPGWAGEAEASTVRELRSFAAGLRNDWAAVTAGLTLPYSSGAVEGHVNRIKMIKRQMYGRAKPDLLPID